MYYSKTFLALERKMYTQISSLCQVTFLKINGLECNSFLQTFRQRIWVLSGSLKAEKRNFSFWLVLCVPFYVQHFINYSLLNVLLDM